MILKLFLKIKKKEEKEQTVNDMLDEISKEKDETKSNKKSSLITKNIQNGNEYDDDIKIKQYLLKKQNEKFNVVRSKFKKQLDLIKKMKCKIDLDHIKLQNRIEKNKNNEKDHYIRYQISLIKQKKKKEEFDLLDIE